MTSAMDWQLNNEDIASIASEDLYENRPNRWRGPQATWRALTKEEQDLWTTMTRLRDQNLAIHLYNVFSLKKSAKDETRNEYLKTVNRLGEPVIWRPPKSWTAWPLPLSHLPQEPLLGRDDEADEAWTFKRAGEKMPSSDLQDELGALILRLAKVRYRKREVKWHREARDTTTFKNEVAREQGTSTNHSSDADTVAEGDAAAHTRQRPQRQGPDSLEPRVSIDDDKNYALLRPTVRHILSQLDTTFGILHRMRNTTARQGRRGSESATSADESTRSQSLPRQKGAASRSRSVQQAADPETDHTRTESDAKGKRPEKKKLTKRGRPKKVHIPQDGETEEEMKIRIARQSHRRLPIHAKKKNAKIEAEADTAAAEVSKEDQKAAAFAREFEFQRWVNEGDGETARRKAIANLREGGWDVSSDYQQDLVASWQRKADQQSRPPENTKRKRTARADLLGWSDVVGAAALAGFPEEVIARTAQRCADLFGEGMVLRRLQEVPMASNAASLAQGSVTILPRPLDELPVSEEDSFSSSSSDAGDPSSSRRTSQPRSTESDQESSRRGRSSTPFRRTISQQPGAATSSRRSSYSRPSRSRSGSRSSTGGAGGFFYCPLPSCSRSKDGFARRPNLRRHVERMHPWFEGTAEVDSEDEFVGGVHRDGFLKPIVPGKGWRGEDREVRKRKSHWGSREVRPRINVSGSGQRQSKAE